MTNVTNEERALIEAVISAYHTTRLSDDFVPHIAQKAGYKTAISSALAAKMRGAFHGVLPVEVVDNSSWSLSLHFGQGDKARDRMCAVSDLICAQGGVSFDVSEQPQRISDESMCGGLYPVHGSVTHSRSVDCCDFCGLPADYEPARLAAEAALDEIVQIAQAAGDYALPRPAEPSGFNRLWYRGWECAYDETAAGWTGEGWYACLGGEDLDCIVVRGRTWAELLDEIDDHDKTEKMA